VTREPTVTTTRERVSREELPATVERLLASGWRLTLASAQDLGDELRIVHLLLRPVGERREVEVVVPADDAWVPTLAGLSWTGGRFDREIRDLYGIEPRDHPLPRRMVRHGHWPTGWYPHRRGHEAVPEFMPDVGSYPFVHVTGPGVYEIPVGPVHAGLIEPGHFRFSVVGETIVRMKARLWFVHRGVERHLEGRAPRDALALTERISGDTAIGHSLAFAMAVEEALGLPVSPRDRVARALLLELERLHNHVADLGAIVNDVGFGLVNTHTQRLRERLLRHHETVTGHRLLRGGITLGGATLRGRPDQALVDETATEAQELVELSLDHPTVRDRLTGTAVLDTETARHLDTVGYVARASGLPGDARHDHPFLALPEWWSPVVHESGDVLARFQVRADELRDSARLIGELGARWADGPDDPADADGSPPGAERSGAGVVEAWRGTLATRVELAGDGTLARVKVVDPSFLNWPALPVALADTIVPDFPLANKSFNQSYAGNDL